MAFLSVLPVSFSANKVGYNKYLAAGGGLDYAAFKTWERSSRSEVLIERSVRYSNAINYAIDMLPIYLEDQDYKMVRCTLETYAIRLKQYFDSIKELKSL
jgi:hypothetical protein